MLHSIFTTDMYAFQCHNRTSSIIAEHHSVTATLQISHE